MAALVATERDLWFNLSNSKWKDTYFLIKNSPPRSRAVNTSFYGAGLTSMSSGDRSANPATSCASGRSGLWRAHISRSTQKCSGLGVPAPSEEDFRVISSDASCWFTVSGHRSVRTNRYKSRNQSREAGTSSRIFGSVGTSAKYISLGPADYRKRVLIQFRSPRFMGVLSTEVAPQQVLVMEQEVKALLEKGAIEYVPHSNRETGFYSRYFIVPKKDWGCVPFYIFEFWTTLSGSSSSKC